MYKGSFALAGCLARRWAIVRFSSLCYLCVCPRLMVSSVHHDNTLYFMPVSMAAKFPLPLVCPVCIMRTYSSIHHLIIPYPVYSLLGWVLIRLILSLRVRGQLQSACLGRSPACWGLFSVRTGLLCLRHVVQPTGVIFPIRKDWHHQESCPISLVFFLHLCFRRGTSQFFN